MAGEDSASNANPPGREPDPGRRYRVLVVDEARIVDRGERLRIWYVEVGAGLVKACEHPALEPAEGSETGPGTPAGVIWERPNELYLPVHTFLMCRTSVPHVERLLPLEYLEKGKFGIGRKVIESRFRLVGNYRLERAEVGDFPAEGPSAPSRDR